MQYEAKWTDQYRLVQLDNHKSNLMQLMPLLYGWYLYTIRWIRILEFWEKDGFLWRTTNGKFCIKQSRAIMATITTVMNMICFAARRCPRMGGKVTIYNALFFHAPIPAFHLCHSLSKPELRSFRIEKNLLYMVMKGELWGQRTQSGKTEIWINLNLHPHRSISSCTLSNILH